MARISGGVKVHDTRNLDGLACALLDLTGFLNSPRRDDILLHKAGVSLDRALFPLLVRLGVQGPLAVAELAELVGRDHTTVSRQLAKLETLALVERLSDSSDRRRKASVLTVAGRHALAAIGKARQQALREVLVEWNADDRAALTSLIRRFADDLVNTADRKR